MLLLFCYRHPVWLHRSRSHASVTPHRCSARRPSRGARPGSPAACGSCGGRWPARCRSPAGRGSPQTVPRWAPRHRTPSQPPLSPPPPDTACAPEPLPPPFPGVAVPVSDTGGFDPPCPKQEGPKSDTLCVFTLLAGDDRDRTSPGIMLGLEQGQG